MKTERRVIPLTDVQIELRMDEGGNEKRTIVGYAAVFGSESVNLGGFTETIKRGAFKDSLESDDVRALKNHDPNLLLGRSSNGTLRLKEDKNGLRMEIDIPNTTTGRDTEEEIRRGDLSGASFSFETIDDKWETKREIPHRTLLKARVYDVGPVAFPAYPDTSLAIRSLDRWNTTHIAEDSRLVDLEDVNHRLDMVLSKQIQADTVRETEGESR